MADEVREYIRAAQEAELRGDQSRAVELLRKAAALVRSAGNSQRALQLLRHAQRLDGGAEDLAEEIHRLEWLPDKPMARTIEEAEDADSDREELAALQPLEELEQGEKRKLVERGPTRADPSLAAWCSFCCRPRSEVGDLVAGPAGAFICLACVRESQRLLGAGPLPPAPPAPAATRVQAPLPAAAADFVGQAGALQQVERALKVGVGWLLVVGPEGSGKSTFLRTLAKRGLGRYLATPAALAEPWDDERLLLDGLEGATPADLDALEEALDRVPRLVLAVRGGPLPPALLAAGEEGELPLYSTRDLVAACAGLLPVPVAERVQAAVALRAPTAEELLEVARRLVVERASELDISDDLLQAIAAQAARSPRGGHELKALLDRVPPGSWTLKAAPKAGPAAGPRKRRGRGKGDAPP